LHLLANLPVLEREWVSMPVSFYIAVAAIDALWTLFLLVWLALAFNNKKTLYRPYRFVRHPIYTGILLAILGTFLALIRSPSALLIFLLVTALFFHKLRLEEKLMRDTFPTQYPAYQQHVKALIPFVL
jgi:protein-S-isoprenylcysteine O-methyltransferase Ste14